MKCLFDIKDAGATVMAMFARGCKCKKCSGRKKK